MERCQPAGQGASPVRQHRGRQATRGEGWRKPSSRRQAKRAAPTARRRQGLKPAGARRHQRLAAPHESDAQPDHSLQHPPSTSVSRYGELARFQRSAQEPPDARRAIPWPARRPAALPRAVKASPLRPWADTSPRPAPVAPGTASRSRRCRWQGVRRHSQIPQITH